MLQNDSFVPGTYTDIMVVCHSVVITLVVEPNFSTTDLPVHTTVQPLSFRLENIMLTGWEIRRIMLLAHVYVTLSLE